MNIYLYKERRDGATLRDASVKVGHRRGVSGKSFGGSVARRRASRHRRYLSTNKNNKEFHNLFLIFFIDYKTILRDKFGDQSTAEFPTFPQIRNKYFNNKYISNNIHIHLNLPTIIPFFFL